MTTTTKKVIKTAARLAIARAGMAGREAARHAAARMIMAADAALVDAGRSAKRRQRRRAVKHTLKVAGKAALMAGTLAATVMVVRARARKVTV
jgi:hypothetical protein